MEALLQVDSPDLADRPSSERYTELMGRYLGARVVTLFGDPDVTEVYANADGVVRVDTHSRGKVDLDIRLSPQQIEQFLASVATRDGVSLDRRTPSIQSELPRGTFGSARLQGFVPPVVERSAFVLRKRATRLFHLGDYVDQGVITPAQRAVLERAVVEHDNVLVAGGTGSGKTTLCNALIAEMTERFPAERFVVLEDTAELQCAADDHLSLQTSEGVSIADLVKMTLRCAPDRIIVGEVRDEAALHLVDAWATGHPGGCATVHATSAAGALLRLGRLAQRAGVPPQHELIAEAVGLVVVIQGGNRGRRVTEMARVGDRYDGAFELTPVGPCTERPPMTQDLFPPPALAPAGPQGSTAV